MVPEITPISRVHSRLVAFVGKAQKELKRFVITRRGKPQAVLIGYEDYMNMNAALEVARRSDVLRSIERSLEQIRQGETLSMDEVEASLDTASKKRSKVVST